MKIEYKDSNVVSGQELITEGKYYGTCVKRTQQKCTGRVTSLYIVTGKELINLSNGSRAPIALLARYEIVNAKVVVE